MELMHASCVVFQEAGLLLRGAAGVGKSDLVLRLIDRHGAQLVADDQTCLEREDGQVFASAPAKLKGWLQVTNIGFVQRPVCARTPLMAVIDLVPTDQRAALPLIAPDETTKILSLALPRVTLCSFDVSAPEKISALLEVLRQGGLDALPDFT